MGRLGALLEASWAVFERREAEKARRPKSFQNFRKTDDFGLLGLSSEASWKPLGALLGPLGCLLGPFGGFLGPSWGILGAFLGPSWRLPETCLSFRGPVFSRLGPVSGLLGALLWPPGFLSRCPASPRANAKRFL